MRKDIAFESSTMQASFFNQLWPKRKENYHENAPLRYPQLASILKGRCFFFFGKIGRGLPTFSFREAPRKQTTNRWKFNMLGLIVDPHNDQLPTGLITHWTGIAEVRVRIRVRSPSSLQHKLREKTARLTRFKNSFQSALQNAHDFHVPTWYI